jgi:hypothetical protein
MAFRERHKTQQRAQHQEPPSTAENKGPEQTESDGAERAPSVTHKRTLYVTHERTPIERWQRTRMTTSSDEKLPSDALLRPSRLAFVEQLQKQQPEGAAGYRLVLPMGGAAAHICIEGSAGSSSSEGSLPPPALLH